MCGRTALYLPPHVIQQNLQVQRWENEQLFRQSFNVCPTRFQPVLLRNDATQTPPQQNENESEKNLHLVSMKWGLVPAWKLKNNPNGTGITPLVNARDDSLTGNKPMFNGLKQRQRCAVVAQGYYEWLRKNNEATPHYVKRKDDKLMIFAALYDKVTVEGQISYTYTIVTTAAPPSMVFLHTRMPVRLDHDETSLMSWLDPGTQFTKHIANLLLPIDDGLDIYKVSQAVGKVGNDFPELVERAPETKVEKSGSIANFFAPVAKGGSKRKPETIDAKEEVAKVPKTEVQVEDPKSSDDVLEKKTSELKHDEPAAKSPSKSPREKQQPEAAVKSLRKSPTKHASVKEGNSKITSFFSTSSGVK